MDQTRPSDLIRRDVLTLVTVMVVVGSGFFFFGQVSNQLENLSIAVQGLTAQVASMGAIDNRQDKELAIITGSLQVLDREIKARHHEDNR